MDESISKNIQDCEKPVFNSQKYESNVFLVTCLSANNEISLRSILNFDWKGLNASPGREWTYFYLLYRINLKYPPLNYSNSDYM